CNKVGVLESNFMAMVITPYSCIVNTCDEGGCGYSSYASGQRNYSGPSKAEAVHGSYLICC
ncbi:hypothetical protein DL95DRAFT_322068, partial [Leptodontidium sp. 2 PMI_412]